MAEWELESGSSNSSLEDDYKEMLSNKEEILSQWIEDLNGPGKHFPSSKFTLKGPAVSRKQFIFALSVFATRPQLYNGRLKGSTLLTTEEFPELAPSLYSKKDKPIDLPIGFLELLQNPFGQQFFDSIREFQIYRMTIWRHIIGISGQIIVVKENWDFLRPRVVMETDEGYQPFNCCPPTLIEAFLIGRDTAWPIIGLDITFKAANTEPWLLEDYRTSVFPRLLNWANGSEFQQRCPVYPDNEKPFALIEIMPSPCPSFFDQEGAVKSQFSFFHAISIFATKPQVLNKWLRGAELHARLRPRFYRIIAEGEPLQEISEAEYPPDFLEMLKEPLTPQCVVDLQDFGVDQIILIRTIIGKTLKEHTTREIWDLKNARVVIEYVEGEEVSKEFPPLLFDAYMVGENKLRIMIGMSGRRRKFLNNCNWLLKSLAHYESTTLTSVLKWAAEEQFIKNGFIPRNSLVGVPVKLYYEEYEGMKKKHFLPLREIWTESTDPLKFIPEEIGIAAYVKTYIEKVSLGPWAFVDAGCGNGVLSYVLANAGIQGYGFDIRPRTIWKKFNTIGVKPTLLAKSFNPFLDKISPHKNQWLLGNHCDELTPWIPVMARMAKAKGFVLIPCCFYDFNGKFQRKAKSTFEGVYQYCQSRYESYLHYIAEVCKRCGFEIFVDKLRIPSTKRICIIGVDRSLSEEESQQAMEYAASKMSSYPTSDQSIVGFTPRSPVERVNNCSQLNRVLVEGIVVKIFKKLLSSENFFMHDGYRQPFDCGIPFKLRELVEFLDPEERTAISRQGKGLQTLLRNFNQGFIIERGYVRIRRPIVDENNSRGKSLELKVRSAPCFFYNYHPEGCPLRDLQCTFKH